MKLRPMHYRLTRDNSARDAVLAALNQHVSAWPQAYIRDMTGNGKSQTHAILQELMAIGDVVEVWASRLKGGARLYALTLQGRRKV